MTKRLALAHYYDLMSIWQGCREDKNYDLAERALQLAEDLRTVYHINDEERMAGVLAMPVESK